MDNRAFTFVEGRRPDLPVLLSVPHAGRAYDGWTDNLRVPLSAVQVLEDRFADTLVDGAIAAGLAAVIANVPRLAIDLNRAPRDMDPSLVDGWQARGIPVSMKARSGLGLIPSRLAGPGDLWAAPISATEVERRIAAVHRPYHAAIAARLAAMHGRHGAALLIDVHSMPTIADALPAQVVIGDRFGTTAASNMTETALAIFAGLGFRTACNAPYAGDYVVMRHAAPAKGIHAIQIEFDRATYLDAAHDRPGDGLDRVQDALLRTALAMARELILPHRQAAE